jgi:hypothetical protein
MVPNVAHLPSFTGSRFLRHNDSGATGEPAANSAHGVVNP